MYIYMTSNRIKFPRIEWLRKKLSANIIYKQAN